MHGYGGSGSCPAHGHCHGSCSQGGGVYAAYGQGAWPSSGFSGMGQGATGVGQATNQNWSGGQSYTPNSYGYRGGYRGRGWRSRGGRTNGRGGLSRQNWKTPSGRQEERVKIAMKIDKDRLKSEDHEWDVNPTAGLNFRRLVDNENPRRDFFWYKKLDGIDHEKANSALSRFGSQYVVTFVIPATIDTQRTFARSVEEAYYVSHMAQFLTEEPKADEVLLSSIPLLNIQLDNAWFHAFSKRSTFMSERQTRMKDNIWVPGDAPELESFTIEELSTDYPKVESWVDDVFQPACLPVPSPMVVYYYFKEVKEAQEAEGNKTERQKKLLLLLRAEWYVLYCVQWMAEASHGKRQYLLTKSTVDTLKKELNAVEDKVLFSNRTAGDIIGLMQECLRRSEKDMNYVNYLDMDEDKTAFFWADASGEYDRPKPTGVNLYAGLGFRRVMEEHQVEDSLLPNAPDAEPATDGDAQVLDTYVYSQDLEGISGLGAFASSQGWLQDGGVSIGTLVTNLFNNVNRHVTEVSKAEKRAASAEAEREGAVRREERMSGYVKGYAAASGRSITLPNERYDMNDDGYNDRYRNNSDNRYDRDSGYGNRGATADPYDNFYRSKRADPYDGYFSTPKRYASYDRNDTGKDSYQPAKVSDPYAPKVPPAYAPPAGDYREKRRTSREEHHDSRKPVIYEVDKDGRSRPPTPAIHRQNMSPPTSPRMTSMRNPYALSSLQEKLTNVPTQGENVAEVAKSPGRPAAASGTQIQDEAITRTGQAEKHSSVFQPRKRARNSAPGTGGGPAPSGGDNVQPTPDKGHSRHPEATAELLLELKKSKEGDQGRSET